MEALLIRIVKIQFKHAGKLYNFNPGTIDLIAGDRVIVETERGKSIGSVAVEPREYSETDVPEGIKTILRKTLPEDLMVSIKNAEHEKEAHALCMTRIKERGLEMKLVKVDYMFDGSKAVFYFTADGRIDFRELVKDLAHVFHTRIEMRQIGVRDAAKMISGLGICGREICCASFLREFEPVSVKMAKEQNLALNPTKISGQCGRLLCCLGYEFETYCKLKKCLPKCGKRVSYGDSEGEVVKLNILKGTVTIKTDDNQEVVLKGDDIKLEDIQNKPKTPQKAREKEGADKSTQGVQKEAPNAARNRPRNNRSKNRKQKPDNSANN